MQKRTVSRPPHSLARHFSPLVTLPQKRSRLHLQGLASKRAALLASWQEKQELFEQCMELQLFLRDTEQADSWMAKQEVS